ncbi:hypothetical protein DIPPA_35453 [Diplonema papillatum]|nr:hypothetical protein DIPPA_35453 [Diplonema papillatum]
MFKWPDAEGRKFTHPEIAIAADTVSFPVDHIVLNHHGYQYRDPFWRCVKSHSQDQGCADCNSRDPLVTLREHSEKLIKEFYADDEGVNMTVPGSPPPDPVSSEPRCRMCLGAEDCTAIRTVCSDCQADEDLCRSLASCIHQGIALQLCKVCFHEVEFCKMCGCPICLDRFAGVVYPAQKAIACELYNKVCSNFDVNGFTAVRFAWCIPRKTSLVMQLVSRASDFVSKFGHLEMAVKMADTGKGTFWSEWIAKAQQENQVLHVLLQDECHYGMKSNSCFDNTVYTKIKGMGNVIHVMISATPYMALNSASQVIEWQPPPCGYKGRRELIDNGLWMVDCCKKNNSGGDRELVSGHECEPAGTPEDVLAPAVLTSEYLQALKEKSSIVEEVVGLFDTIDECLIVVRFNENKDAENFEQKLKP